MQVQPVEAQEELLLWMTLNSSMMLERGQWQEVKLSNPRQQIQEWPVKGKYKRSESTCMKIMKFRLILSTVASIGFI